MPNDAVVVGVGALVAEAPYQAYRLAKAVHSHNGPPFAVDNAGRLTRITLGWGSGPEPQSLKRP